MAGTILFVHGTGVRFAAFRNSHEAVQAAARSVGLEIPIVPCLWGDPLGIEFAGRSLPDPPDGKAALEAAAEDESWAWRFDDPLIEICQMTIAGADAPGLLPPGREPEWMTRLAHIRDYAPSSDLSALLGRALIDDLWDKVWGDLMAEPVLELAFERSSDAGELADCEAAVARALVAMLHNEAIAQGRPGPSAAMRGKLLERLGFDWGVVYGLGDALHRLVARAATAALRRHRNPFNHAIAAQVGDILLYQARGDDVRAFIREAILAAEPPVTLVAHSLGGIACVDLLAMTSPPLVANLVTIGSQSPYFYEIGALASLKPPEQLPVSFPRWLNLFDRNDFLSFVGSPLFGERVRDIEIRSGQPFPASHSAYLASEEVWSAIRELLD